VNEPRASIEGLKYHVQTRDQTLATWRNLVIVVWSGTVTVPALRSVETASRDVLQRFPQGNCAVSLTLEETPMPGAEVRRVGSELARDLGPRSLASATVIEGSGFFASAARSVIAGVMLVSGVRATQRVFSSIDEVGGFIAPHIAAGRATPHEVVGVVRAIRAAIARA
jgi:hypothetical protein